MNDDNYSLNLPVLKSEVSFDKLKVTNESGEELRNCLQLLSNYFVKEFFCDRSIKYADPFLDSKLFSAYLFAEQTYDLIENMNEFDRFYRIYGACCFSQLQVATSTYWVLEWIWLHPFFRHRGKLSTFWKGLEKEFGDFFIKMPISNDMKSFLENSGGKHKSI